LIVYDYFIEIKGSSDYFEVFKRVDIINSFFSEFLRKLVLQILSIHLFLALRKGLAIKNNDLTPRAASTRLEVNKLGLNTSAEKGIEGAHLL